MPRLTVDPNTAVRPDFASEDYADARTALISADIDNDGAVAMLTKAWDAGNAAEKAIWARQVRADEEEAEAAARQAIDIQDQEDTQRRHEAETANAEERKKNRTKYIELSEAPPPITPPEILPTYATTRLQKGQYVEMWYFTNEGIAGGLKHASSIDENAMTQAVDKDGSITWIPATASKALRDAKADRDLSWEQLLVASPRFLEAIHAAGWPEQRQRMMSNLFTRIQAHPRRYTNDPIDRRALLRYLCEQRQAWHLAIDTPTRGWDIGTLSERNILHAVETVRNEEMLKREMERDLLVTPFSLPPPPPLLAPKSPYHGTH
ncbi:hypothetical protein H0H92_004282 [Tricholoma furcatifolium]|nr:hypothetical protein H0H92_004282 [Tricholoma furcatifolium]